MQPPRTKPRGERDLAARHRQKAAQPLPRGGGTRTRMSRAAGLALFWRRAKLDAEPRQGGLEGWPSAKCEAPRRTAARGRASGARSACPGSPWYFKTIVWLLLWLIFLLIFW